MLTNQPFEAQDFQKIAEKWAKIARGSIAVLGVDDIDKHILSAITEATADQVECIELLEKAQSVISNNLRSSDAWVMRLKAEVEKLEDVVNKYEEASVTCPSCKLEYFPSEFGYKPENRPEGGGEG